MVGGILLLNLMLKVSDLYSRCRGFDLRGTDFLLTNTLGRIKEQDNGHNDLHCPPNFNEIDPYLG